MKLEQIREEFYQKRMNVQEYLLNINGYYEILGEIAKVLRDTGIEEIKIDNDKVVSKVKVCGKKISFVQDILNDFVRPPAYLASKRNDIHEINEIKIALSLVRDSDTFFDIGAHQGLYSMIMRKYYQRLTIYSFEPVSAIFNQLKLNFDYNKLTDIKAFEFGFSNNSGTVDFNFNTAFPGASGIKDTGYSNHVKKIKCEIRKLDDFVESHKVEALDYIKCDVEGAELLVLQGGLRAIDRFKPTLQLEMFRRWCAKYDYHPNDIIALLNGYGYKCYCISEGRLGLFEKMTEETKERDFFFIHNSREYLLKQQK